MRKVRVVVEVEVPDTSTLTERSLKWALKHFLDKTRPLNQVALGVEFRLPLIDRTFRRVDVKELRRVVEHFPGGVRDYVARDALIEEIALKIDAQQKYEGSDFPVCRALARDVRSMKRTK